MVPSYLPSLLSSFTPPRRFSPFFLHSFLHSFLPSLLPEDSFLHFFLPSLLSSLIHSCLPSLLTPFTPSSTPSFPPSVFHSTPSSAPSSTPSILHSGTYKTLWHSIISYLLEHKARKVDSNVEKAAQHDNRVGWENRWPSCRNLNFRESLK